ncbi:MAG: imidazole glycerol phosphate synthase subunit HisF [Candidatus Omnitrophica bacterium]|nr:imidazole glycerol phosphate synthase subunit HisF [Candidatus Omnitrophota bacterium]
MLKNRIIPILLLKNGRCVKGKQFGNFRDTGAPVSAAKVYDAQRVDELVFLDILASKEERDILLPIVTETAQECFMPLTVGGGIKTIEDMKVLFAAGADKICINTAAVENPQLILEASQYFGRANIVVAIDYRENSDGLREVYTHAGTRTTGLNALAWCRTVDGLGAGEIILTSIDREGSMSGYDLEFIRQVTQLVSVPVIAHGGAGTLAHLKEGVTVGGASGVAAASIFHFTDQSPIKARAYLKDNQVNVRV